MRLFISQSILKKCNGSRCTGASMCLTAPDLRASSGPEWTELIGVLADTSPSIPPDPQRLHRRGERGALLLERGGELRGVAGADDGAAGGEPRPHRRVGGLGADVGGDA